MDDLDNNVNEELDGNVNDRYVADVYIDEFEAFLVEKRGMLSCKSCGHKELGAIGYSNTGKCSVMSIKFSALNDGRWEDEGHGQPVYVAECANCGCMTIYNARTVVQWLLEIREREKRWEK